MIFFSVVFNIQSQASTWILIDNFEQKGSANTWTKADTQNETSPKVNNPQITERRNEGALKTNAYLIKKAAESNGLVNTGALMVKVKKLREHY